MRLGSGLRSMATLSRETRVNAQPTPSGVRPNGAARPNDALRALAREAESLELDALALELFFIASRIDATDRLDLARLDLEQAAVEASQTEARFYRRAAWALGMGPDRTA